MTVDFEIRNGVGTLVATADTAELARAFVLKNKLRFPTLRVERVETTIRREVIYRPRANRLPTHDLHPELAADLAAGAIR